MSKKYPGDEPGCLSEYGLKTLKMERKRGESYNTKPSSHTGEYRSYEDYLESGGPVDPCDDAIWLNDEA